MDARIVIDLATATPPYEQVQKQISSLISIGELRPGTRLPTVRSLAADLGVAAGTVARAYKELEAAGRVATNRRQGTVVAQSADHADVPAEVMAAVEHLIKEGKQAGLADATIVTVLQGRLNQRGK
ncbi:GntR family transcriptional regulator [Arthrobacter psychrolactophilus]|uniref:GntR family transcriptional regulator n=1 Tax=Arthrobacter psychrolactophilus TaxID=92442 RepID=A0A2V5JAH4_9MICC|nr:GntR family transcriptional regulator [Arthrobacter psychrolactophilus]PYI40310.1 GntR family transcriptional regulator [Arthrobacter psychrolactophilus]